MPEVSSNSITSRYSFVIAVLTVFTLAGFLFVSRLVRRFQEQQKAVARHLYFQGLAEQQAGKPELALAHFRSALTYSRDNFQYELSLARALRDSGRTDEAQTYLISLWERAPQDGAVNLALGRLAARQNSLEKLIQYYHNAIYGVWGASEQQNRVNAWFELIEVLLRLNARPQAQAELIALSASLPMNSDLLLRDADLCMRAQDYEHAFSEYHKVLQVDRANPHAAVGVAEAAFNLGRYRTAEHYLEAASKESPSDPQIARMLEVSKLIVQQDPFSRGLSTGERTRRIRVVFSEAGKRLDSCMNAAAQNSTTTSQEDFASLKDRWQQMDHQLRRIGREGQSGLADSVMDLVLKIEQETGNCVTTAQDEALLLLAQNRGGVEQ